MDRIIDLVQQLEPETAPPSQSVEARQRDSLLRLMATADDAPMRPRRWRSRHKGWVVAIASVAAVAIVVATLVPGSSSPPRPPAAASVVLTAITSALANTSGDIEEVQSTVPGAPVSTASWVDLSTGACRTNTSLNGQPSLTVFVERGKAVVIDFGDREWWTRASGGVTCEPMTPQTIERDVTTGRYVVAGHVNFDGQPALKLVALTTTTGLHPVTKASTLWVNATTYLPIESTATGHLTERTHFTWLPATATNTTVLKISVPAGFKRAAAPGR